MAIILKGSPSASINTSHKLQPKQPGVELLDNGYSRLKIGSTTNLSNLDDPNGWIEWSNLPYATPNTQIYGDDQLNGPSGYIVNSTAVRTNAFVGTTPNADGTKYLQVYGTDASGTDKPTYVFTLNDFYSVSETGKNLGVANYPWTTAYITNLKGLATPTDSSDAATKGYIDDAIETTSNGIASSITNLQEQINGKQALVNASGILKGDGTSNIVSAVKGTDYPDPAMYTSTGIVLPDNANDTIRFGFYGGMDLFFLSSTEFYPNLANCNLGSNNGHYWMNGYIKYLKSYTLRLMDQNSTGTTTDDKDGMTMQYNEEEQCIEFLAE